MNDISLMSRAELVCELITSTPTTTTEAAATYAETRDSRLAGIRDALVSYKLAVARALLLRNLAERMKSEPVLSAPATVRDWLRLHCAHLEHEVFIILLLDAQTSPHRGARAFSRDVKSNQRLPRVLDHFVVAGTNIVSFAERGLI